MTTSDDISKKNELILELNLLRTQKNRRKMFEVASKAASLEVKIAVDLVRSRPDHAAINLISAASCLQVANRIPEAKRILTLAHASASGDAKAWILDALLPLSKTEIPGGIFSTAVPNIGENESLRRPQRDAYVAARVHFEKSRDHAIIQLPVGCGKTGTMALLPFGMSAGRVLAIAPNLEIARNLASSFDHTLPSAFLRRSHVLPGEKGPTSAILNADANLHDCDRSDFVVANIQQLVARGRDKWLSQLSPDYFDMILVDEGHHNVASSWQDVFSHFSNAKVTSFTATPMRADGKQVEGKPIYRFPIASAIKEGYVRDIASRRLEPVEISFTYEGSARRHSLDEVLKLREELWFSKGVALSPECNKHIVDASIDCVRELRNGGEVHHQIIGAACSIDHAKQIRSLYAERGLAAKVIHSELASEEQDEVRRELKSGALDVVVQVQMLGEGADYPTLGVAAIFRPFRHLVPYVQFVGRVMRVSVQNAPGNPDNRGFVVSHVGLNVDRWWSELRELDGDDQLFFESLANGEREFDKENHSSDQGERRKFKPPMEVVDEVIEHFVQERFLPEDQQAFIDDLVRSLELRGLDLDSLGITKEELRARISTDDGEGARRGTFSEHPVQPQRARQEARTRLNERVRSASKQLLNELRLAIVGRELVRAFPETGTQNNLSAAIILLNSQVQVHLHVESNERDVMTLEQLQRAHDEMDDIIDAVAKRVRAKWNS